MMEGRTETLVMTFLMPGSAGHRPGRGHLNLPLNLECCEERVPGFQWYMKDRAEFKSRRDEGRGLRAVTF